MRGETAVLESNFMPERTSICRKNFRLSDAILTGLIYLCAGIAMLLLIGIMGYVFV